MYTIQIKETRLGEISFDTIEEAKQWYEDREGDVYWYHDDESIKLEREVEDEYGDKSLQINHVLTTEDITKELNW
tara:strand:+ start:143 stop:367 length:225 start_codon:yes stop_codon:yes gene_type:complete